MALINNSVLHSLIDYLCVGLATCQPLWVILCRLIEKGRRDSRGNERNGQKTKRNETEETKEIKHSFSTLNCCKDSTLRKHAYANIL